MLKGVIFSLHDVLLKEGAIDAALFDETIRLLRFLPSRSVKPVFIGNHDWTVTSKGQSRPFRELLEERIGPVGYYVAGRDGMPYKPKADATAHVQADQGWDRREVIYVGNSPNDMKTAANGRLMFLNAMWHSNATPYGFQFNSPLDIARFVDCLCLGLKDWFWALEKDDLRVYALAPFTTMSARYAQAHAYSENARSTSKHGIGDANFWGRLLIARVYFSGLVDEIDYIAAYPGHAPDSKPTVIADALNILGQSQRKSYMPDLVVRHKKAVKSQTARSSGGSVGVENQVNTIMLNRTPTRGVAGPTYKNPPVRAGKTVLLVDDICTEGNSFEAGRAFIDATGARTICLSWLKTINTDYRAIVRPIPSIDPYRPVTGSGSIATTPHGYSSAIRTAGATTDLAAIHNRYSSWAWPEGI
ncbi:MAG: hypothetical protein A2095_02670 [Sphingomonadales bacterium GWF1_63_6]|nr:MAG: hypothetical protein A2095_02670 [Sphingomonadales bacterium GWF1_63_6]